ncbi:hypothetical protein SNE40_019079 [Patella caerulea]|uniref:non-specific serine/threonine protein kinase n=1 Tax=Patella caerulea TaxID=87958 RepID=A0AAN8J6F6_PATCE
MDYLSDVHSCCRALDSDKVTERKRNAEKLQNLLNKSSVIQTLDKNSDDRHSKSSGRLLTWDCIFKAVILYVRIESSNLKKAKEKISAISHQNREKKKQEIGGLVKFVVRLADKRGPRLRSSSLLSTILEVLRDDFMCSAYGLDFSNILLKNILPVRKYWTELKSDNWHELLIQYCKLFVDEDCTLDRVVQSCLIFLLLSGASKQCDLHPQKIIRFFTEVFKNIRKEKASRVLEYILSSLNIFITTIAPYSRRQVCKLGENIFINILYLWNNRPSSKMKDEIVAFLRSQLQIHHPGGAKTVHDGAFALDWDQWMSHLRKLYEVLYNDLKEMGGRHRFSSSKEAALKPEYADLAANVCHQIFDQTTHNIDVTQLPSTNDESGLPAKKRRLESGWSALRDIIYKLSNTMQIIPWLQLLSRLVEKYPGCIPEDELQPLLSCLTQIMEDGKKNEILKHLIICIKKFVDGYPLLGYIHTSILNDCRKYWQKIWASTLRNVSSHRAELEGLHTPGFQLLTALIQQKLVTPEKYVWNLFLPSISSPTTASVNFLSVYLSSFDLPENYKPSILGSGELNNTVGHPLRLHLLDWLLPKRETSEICDKKRYVCDSNNLSCVLIGLILRNPEIINQVKHQSSRDSHLINLEKIYLQSSLDCQLEFEKSSTCDNCETSINRTCHMSDLLVILSETFEQEVSYYDDVAEFQLIDLESLSTLCSVLSKCLYHLLKLDILSSDSCHTSSIYTSLHKLMKKLSTWFCEFVSKEGINKLMGVVKNLQEMFFILYKDQPSFVIMEINRALTPSRLIDQLVEITLDKLPRTNSTNKLPEIRRSRQSTSKIRPIDDFEDLGFDDFPSVSLSNKTNDNDEDMMDIDMDTEIPDSQDSDDIKEQSEVCLSLLAADSLTESQSLRLEVIRLLCLWCSHDTSMAPSTILLKSDVTINIIKEKLFKLLDEDLFDSHRAIDLQILRCLMYGLTKETHKVTDGDLENLADGVREVAKNQRRDQEICQLCLNMINILIPYCIDSNDMTSKIKLDSRNVLLCLLTAFWKMSNESQYTSAVRLKLVCCMETCVKYDPKSEWSMMKSKGNNNETEEILVSEELIKCLNDYSHEVRLFVSSAIQRLFWCDMTDIKEPEDDKIFGTIYQICHDLLDIPDKVSTDRKHDEILNRTCSLLLTLATIAVSSQLCEKKAVFAFCQMIREKNLDKKLVHKILCKIAIKLGYKNVTCFLISHLPFIINQWLTLLYPIAEFPYQLLGISDIKDFYRTYKHILIPELFMKKDIESIKTICSDIEDDMKVVILDCVPRIVVHILPLFAVSSNKELQSDTHVRRRLALATTSYNTLCQIITKEEFNKAIVDNLHSIVVNILMCLHDDEQANVRPEPNPPCYNRYIILSTLDYLTTSFSGSPSLVTVLIKTQDAIQRILLELSLALSHEHRLHEKQRILEMYQLFIKLLLQVFHQQLGGSWVYVLRDVLFRLVYTLIDIQNNRNIKRGHEVDVILEMCLSLLYDVCKVAVEHCPQELCKYLRLITSHVITCVKYGGAICDMAKSILQLVVLDNTNVMKPGILRLDSFPSADYFKPFEKKRNQLKNVKEETVTLQKELEFFLEVCEEDSNGPCSYKQLLLHLYKQLTSIDPSYLILQLKNNITDSEVSILHSLVRRLLVLLQSGNVEEKMEAAKCLGVIGPVDLSVLALSQQPARRGLREALTVYDFDPDREKYCRIFHQLDQYLCDPSIDIVKCAGEVLKNMLATKTGINFSTEYKDRMSDKDYLFHYLQPFRTKKKFTITVSPPISVDKFVAVIDKEDLWIPSSTDHDIWITNLTCDLLKSESIHDDLLYLLHPLCSLKPDLCDLVLPYIIYDILLNGSTNHRDVLSCRINSFFKAHCKPQGKVPCISKDMKSVQTMLDVIQYLRQQERPKQGHAVKTPWDNNFWLDVNYLYIAKAAHFCSAHFSSLLYAEIWFDVCKEESHGGQSTNGSQSQGEINSQEINFSMVTSSKVNEDVDLQDLMLETYRSIGDPDGIYGCGAGSLADSTSRIKTYIHENRWDKAVVTYNIDMALPNSTTQYGFYQSVKEFGASSLLNTCLQGMVSKGLNVPYDIEELQYEAAWKTGQWNLHAPVRLENGIGFHQGLYCGVEALKHDQLLLMEKAITSARCEIVNTVELYGECCNSIYPLLSKLHCLQQLDQLYTLLTTNTRDYKELIDSWNNSDIPVNDFSSIEPILILRSTSLKVLYNKDDNNPVLQNGLIQTLLHLSKQARVAGKFQVSEQAIYDLRHIHHDDIGSQLLTDMEEAKLYWARSENDIGKNLIKKLISNAEKLQNENNTAVKLLPMALGTYGNWLSETRSENPTVIMENFLERTVELLSETTDDESTCLEAFLSLARFADNQYQNIVNYMKSSTYEAKQALLKKAKEDAEQYKTVATDKDRYLRILEKQSEMDERELSTMKEDRSKFLLKALEFYLRCLRCGDKYDLRIFRVIALWFDDCNSAAVNDLLMNNIESIKSYKFLPLMYQLAARMGSSNKGLSTFQQVLNKILERTAIDHPHHALSIILALAFANKDTELSQQGRSNKRTSKGGKSASKEEDRVESAKNMISRLKHDDKICNILGDMEKLFEAYIQLANTSAEQHRKESRAINLSGGLSITHMKDLTNVAFPTVETRIEASCNYDNIVYIKGFEKSFKLAGGINLPKIITCIGSDGIPRRQLVKGRDDLRQDAVMQQVFGMVNNLLRKNTETRKRKLHIRQYKVIPLSQRSGILEWCEGTQPLGDYLVGNSSVKGAHSKYRPQDLAPLDARRVLQNVHNSSDVRKKYRVFKEVCQKFKPVFRHFFMEKFSQPSVWFERRLAYTRSVATNSIVGYILGLGDRHVQNILVDCNTAELVHIDLGIAFEQGKILPTPETVSFRLTRDIVDGMGPTGVEGVFRRCCEKTMEVMHDNQESLMTIVQVLLYDPLYAWTLSPQKAHALQLRQNQDAEDLNVTANNIGDITSNSDDRSDASQEQVNKLAERVLLRLQQKLQGIEDSVQLSVLGQVNLLIEEARDPKKLCRLFPGWQPHL